MLSEQQKNELLGLIPYQVIDSFVREGYAERASRMKDGSENALLDCLAVYRLEELERLLVTLDGFVGE